ncbi:hypothetical protein GCM10009579_58070 [Streptomyces javensis]|uniref:ATPase AAA-type core domain-containing protein n=1 Tax=Streptomyces javensis TaxID=114698 RepID=A0ABN1X603_9ACTN
MIIERAYAHIDPGSREEEGIRFDAAPRGRRMLGSWAARKGFFLRAETALDALDREGLAPHAVSHGEGFLAAFRGKFLQPGLYVMDEPEAALSFASCLGLIGHLHELVKKGGQVICATHSPLGSLVICGAVSRLRRI